MALSGGRNRELRWLTSHLLAAVPASLRDIPCHVWKRHPPPAALPPSRPIQYGLVGLSMGMHATCTSRGAFLRGLRSVGGHTGATAKGTKTIKAPVRGTKSNEGAWRDEGYANVWCSAWNPTGPEPRILYICVRLSVEEPSGYSSSVLCSSAHIHISVTSTIRASPESHLSEQNKVEQSKAEHLKSGGGAKVRTASFPPSLRSRKDA